jgi:hypothetical protein
MVTTCLAFDYLSPSAWASIGAIAAKLDGVWKDHPSGLEAATNSVQALLGFAEIDQDIYESQESDLEIVLSEFKKMTKEMQLLSSGLTFATEEKRVAELIETAIWKDGARLRILTLLEEVAADPLVPVSDASVALLDCMKKLNGY